MLSVSINGMGRIGRILFKSLLNHKDFEIVAVNDIISTDNLAYLLNFDSIYGRTDPLITSDKNRLVQENGKSCEVYNKNDPGSLPWKQLKIDIVFECTGRFTDKNGMSKHLKAGAKRVILSAPVKGDGVRMVVPGVSDKDSISDKLISISSCTTNCVAPVVEIIGRKIGIRKANMTTVHAYTSSQHLVDGPSEKRRRGRAAALNFIPASTGAAIATSVVLPKYRDKFDGMAIRGPVATGSVVDVNIVTDRITSVNEINSIFKQEAESDRYRGILGVTEEGYVSSDIIRDNRASVVDLEMTQVVDGDLVKLIAWYDNEYGYAGQMIRWAEWIAGTEN